MATTNYLDPVWPNDQPVPKFHFFKYLFLVFCGTGCIGLAWCLDHYVSLPVRLELCISLFSVMVSAVVCLWGISLDEKIRYRPLLRAWFTSITTSEYKRRVAAMVAERML